MKSRSEVKKTNTNKKYIQGMSLLEILIVVSVFSILGILTARSVIVALRGARKSDSQIKVKENISYAFSIMERQLRGAEGISPCPNPDTTTISYTTLDNQESTFSCILTEDTGYIASGSARLTSSEVVVESCEITCTQENENYPPIISISVTATDDSSAGVEKGTVSVETEIVGRNY